jgi:signal transduction histidine kinase
VRGSRPLLSRVLWNLIDNAVRAARPGGRVELRLVDLDGDRVGIDVEDDGPGLEASGDPERLFEPFIRGSLSSEDPGHGLGLALSRAIARRHGGDLQWGVSEKLGGARLRLILPTWSAAPR